MAKAIPAAVPIEMDDKNEDSSDLNEETLYHRTV